MAKQKKVSFSTAFKNFFIKYVDFNGTATRSEYWYMWLFLLALNIFITILTIPTILGIILWAILFLPSRALACRRFHDVGLSCWWYLTPLIFFTVYCAIREETWLFLIELEQVPVDLAIVLGLFLVNALALLVVFTRPSKLKNNKYRKK